MTNQEFATELRALADFYEKEASEDFRRPSLIMILYNKEDVQTTARMVKPFTKDYDGDSEHSFGRIHSKRFPSLNIQFLRSLVCKKTVNWDCEPLLSPEEDAELEEVGK